MGLFSIASKTAARARYAAEQGLRSAWYGAQMSAARRNAGGFNRAGEPKFEPTRGTPDMAALRKAYLDLFIQDRLNAEAGLYPAPHDVRVRDLPNALKSARAFRAESAELYDTQVEALFTGTADAMRRAALAEISRELKGRDQRRASLLDLACGNGRFLSRVMSVYPRLQATGLDLSPSYTDAARKRLARWPQVSVLHEAAEAMPLPEASLDMVVSVFLFHELPPAVRAQVLAEVARILKPGGLFILADSTQFGDYPDMDGLLEYFPHGFHEPYYETYLSWDIADACANAGLANERETLAFLTKVTTWRKA